MDSRGHKVAHLKSLKSLLEGMEYTLVREEDGRDVGEIRLDSVSSDSRKVKHGTLFVAIKGSKHDGHMYIPDAIKSGCVAVICESGNILPEIKGDWQGLLIEVEKSGRAYGLAAANYYGRPAEKLSFIGITGTNGKTTVAYLLEKVLLDTGRKVGVIGTVNNRYVGDSGEMIVLPSRLTTPAAMELQQILREMADSGVHYVIMEISSHALAQYRIGNLLFDAAAFTNLSRDHLDYHGSMEDYFSAKLKLFTEHMAPGGRVVLPAVPAHGEIPFWHESLAGECETHSSGVVFWGEDKDVKIRLLRYRQELSGIFLEIEVDGKSFKFHSPLIGRFNIDNILTVLGFCSVLDIDLFAAVECLGNAEGVPGRLERVVDPMDGSAEGPVVLVDYAHTPDALEQVLSSVSALPHGDLYSVFGCGGERDSGKRPLMGEIGCRFSDVAIVTDDNPRNEDPDEIVRQILAGTVKSAIELMSSDWLHKRHQGERGVIVERDRRKAIRLAVTAAGSGDVVIIAGKGHETYQLSSLGELFFDDRLEVRDVFCSWTGARVAKSVGGKVISSCLEGRLLGEVVTDSRKTGEDLIFVALKGEKFDGHQFAAQAVENGAVCLVVEKEIEPVPGKDVCQILVPDTLKALGDMAGYRRARLRKICDQTIIAITGSCGKTTVKEMVAAILGRKWIAGPDCQEGSVLKTHGNFNNLIGLPLSLLPLNTANRAAVMEVGMNQPGELQRLVQIVDPDISCIVNIHGAHLEGLHSLEGVAKAKEELFEGTREDGLLIINLDDPRVSRLAEKYTQARITYALCEENFTKKPDLRATDIESNDSGKMTFVLHLGREKRDISLFAAGEHNVANALAAAAIAYGAEATIEDITAGLADFRPADKRMEILHTKEGYTLLNDTYNANPASMAAGLKTLVQMSGKYRAAILGDMLELGESAKKAHFEMGQLAAELQLDEVGFIGEFKNDAQEGALAGGMGSDKVRVFADKEEAVLWLKERIAWKKLGQDGLLLVKASRGLRFETIVSELVS